MLSEYCEVLNDLSNPKPKNGEGLLFTIKNLSLNP
jgi:hypothetical protein